MDGKNRNRILDLIERAVSARVEEHGGWIGGGVVTLLSHSSSATGPIPWPRSAADWIRDPRALRPGDPPLRVGPISAKSRAAADAGLPRSQPRIREAGRLAPATPKTSNTSSRCGA